MSARRAAFSRVSPFSGLAAALLAVSAAGCSDERPVSPLLTVEKFDSAQGCYAACGVGPAPELNLPRVCAAPAEACGFRGGADQLRVVVDYGSVQFPAATNVTPPVITLMLDDHEEPSTAPIVRVPDSARVHFTSLMLAPPELVRGLRISAKGGDGFSASVDGLTVSAPTLSVRVATCPDSAPCHLFSDVGAAAILVSAPRGFTPLQGTLSSRLDGYPQAQTVPLTLQPKGAELFEATAFLIVPGPGSNRSGPLEFWDIFASFGSTVSVQNILLSDPPVTVSVQSCPASGVCSLKAGATTVVTVETARGINETQASLSATLDGISTTLQQSADLGSTSAAAEGATFAVQLPNQPGSTWVATGRIGPFSQQSQPVQLIP